MRLYNLLLYLYPAAFRNEYGEEMRPLFAWRRRQAKGFGVLTLWLSTIGEVLTNAWLVHEACSSPIRQDAAWRRSSPAWRLRIC